LGLVTDRPEESAVDRIRHDPRLRTRDDSGLAAISIGTLVWAIVWIVLTIGDLGEDLWRAICVAGFGLGVVGVVFLGFRRARRNRRAQEWPRSRES
jgi:hypothetical protein